MTKLTKNLTPALFNNFMQIYPNLAYGLGLIVAVTIFFQIHISFSWGDLNVNLADPFAILAFLVLSIKILNSRDLPKWEIDHFNIALAALTFILIVGFVNGYLSIGISQWALNGRLLGWFFLLGYLSAGYLIATSKGLVGLGVMAKTMTVTLFIIIIFHVALRLMQMRGLFTEFMRASNFEGFSANRNAFVFQLLITIPLFIIYSFATSSKLNKKMRIKLHLPAMQMMLGMLMAAVVWAGSRAGICIGLMLLFITYLYKLLDTEILLQSIIWAFKFWLGVWLLAYLIDGVLIKQLIDYIIQVVDYTASTISQIINYILSSNHANERSILDFPTSNIVHLGAPSLIQSTLSNEASNHERIATFSHALDMWKQSPLLGAGLGVFFAKSTAWFGHPTVIHNTNLWILAEFGLVGMIIFGWFFWLIVRHGYYSLDLFLQRKSALIMLLLVFFIFGLVHEVFYQRIFWLGLGATLAKQNIPSNNDAQN